MIELYLKLWESQQFVYNLFSAKFFEKYNFQVVATFRVNPIQ